MNYKQQLDNLVNKYQKGAVINSAPPRENKNYSTNYAFASLNPYAKLEFEKQSFNPNTNTYNGVDMQEGLKFYKNKMPSVFNTYFEESDGKFNLKKGKTIEDFQNGYNTALNNSKDLFKKTYGFDEKEVDDYVNNVMFLPRGSKDTSRGVDGKWGEYTNSRSFFQRNVVPKSTLVELNKLGIHTGRDVLNNAEKAKALLGDDLYNNVVKGLDEYKDADYIIGDIEDKVAEESKSTDGLDPNANKDTNFTNTLPIATPDQSNLAPKYFGTRMRGLKAPWNVSNFISPEASIREVNRQSNTARELLSSSNPYTSASAIANLQAQENKSIADATMQANLANQQAQNQTDNINEGRILQTEQYNNQEANAYENRSNIGLDNYYKEWINYNDRLNKENLSNYNLQNQVNAVNATNPNYNIGPNGEIYQTAEKFELVADAYGNQFIKDKDGTFKKVETIKKQGDVTTKTTESNDKTKLKSNQLGGYINANNLRDFLKKNKKG